MVTRFGVSGGLLTRHRSSIASWLVLLVVAATVLVFAVRSEGVTVHRADLNDGGVWVTDSRDGLVGRDNKPLKQLDLTISGASQAGDRLDVLQDQQAVVAVDTDATIVTPVDASLGTASPQDAVKVKSSDVQLGGGVVAVADPTTGKLWATQVSPTQGAGALDGLDETSKPLATVGGHAVLAVSQSGTVYAASTDSAKLMTIESLAGGFAKPTSAQLDPRPAGSLIAMTSVGAEAVWLDSSGQLGFNGHAVDVGARAVLQQPGPAAASVLVAVAGKLLSIDLSSASVMTLATVSGTQPSAPVALGGCAWGLWSTGAAGYVVQKCGSAPVTALPAFPVASGADLVYRVNRRSLLVNDIVNGTVWDVDGAKAQSVADWQSMVPKQQKPDQDNHKILSQQPPKPEAVRDALGARADDTTILHVLDNDKAPAHTTLAITAIKSVDPKVHVIVAPDQQSLLARVDQGVAAGTVMKFNYTIDDGERSDSQATGEVDLTVHGADDAPAAPELRSNYTAIKPPTYPVAVGSSIDIPVLPDWRDPTNGDPVTVQPGSAKASKGSVSITPEGLLRYVAPEPSRSIASPVRLSYRTTTGGVTTAGTADVRIYSGISVAAPVAQPDVASGEVGSSIVIHPLNNDIAGADPVDPGARLALAGNVAPLPGLTVHTDTDSGAVTVTGQVAKSFSLPYHVKYGSAAADAASTIRVIVKSRADTSNTPIAMPDTTAVHGDSPMTVDVLANDYDPRGQQLAVAQATSDDDLPVSVIDGRWIRVSNPSGATGHQAVVHYVVSNGSATAPGSLTVTELAALDPATDAPDTQPDEVTVRAGASVQIPVLDNDSTPSGDPVGLVPDSTATAGTLPITTGDGRAYLDGKYVRFVAPADATRPSDTIFFYTAENTSDPDAGRSTGAVTVHVQPPASPSNPDQAPTPSDLEGRVVTGDAVTLTLPLTGQDPDGDPVTVTGIGDPDSPGSTPRLGQVIGFGGNTLTYQAFPGQTGEDQFTYSVTDGQRTAQGTARVTVVQPGAPQRPVAVDDAVTADPNRTLTVDVLTNDLFSAGTTPQVDSLRNPPHGVSEKDGLINVRPGSRPNALSIPYTISNGLADSSAVLTVHFQKGFDNPPVATSVTATPSPDATTVTAKVLSRVTDIDDAPDRLTITGVDGLGAANIHGDAVTLPVSAEPRVWTYHVRDAENAEAVGSIYEAGRPTDIPYLRKGSVLHLPTDATTTVDVSTYVVAPKAGTRPYLTTDNEIFTAPTTRFSGNAQTPTQQSIKLTTTRVSGPAALTFQVSDSKDLNSTTAVTAMISLPVIVGHPDPTLSCPNEPIEVPESGSRQVYVSSVCHVWQDPTAPKQLVYSAQQGSHVGGIDVSGNDGVVTITATHATVGKTGYVTLGIDGTGETASLPFRVVKLPPPTLLPIPEQHPHAGDNVTLNLAPYLQGGVPADAFEPAIVSVTSTNGGPAARVTGTTVTITPPSGEHGTYTYTVQMSDSGLHANDSRLATGTLSLQVTDVPRWAAGATPSVVGALPQSQEVTLQWPTPDPMGSSVTGYTVTGGNGSTRCGTTTCTIRGLQNGKTYHFSVTADNAVGTSKPIGPAEAEPDDVPTAVTGLSVTRESDGKITYTWQAPRPSAGHEFSPVTAYLISYPGSGSYRQVPSTTLRIPALNGATIDFHVYAINHLYTLDSSKKSPEAVNTVGVASGRPATPSISSIAGTNVSGGGTKAFVVTWGQIDPNGRGTTHYQLTDNGTPVACGGSTWTTALSCTRQVPNDGSLHRFRVQAANDAGVPGLATAIEGATPTHESSFSAATTATAAGTPNGFSEVSLTPTGNDGEATLKYTVGASHGKTGTVTCSGDFSCDNNVGPDGGTVTKTITGLNDGSTATVALQYCNGATASASLAIEPCVTSTSQSVVTYGPLGQPTLGNPSANGTTITVDASVDTKGAAASMTIRNSTTGETHDCGTETTSNFTCTWSNSGLAYATTYSYTVAVNDASGHGRASRSSGPSSATTDPQPNRPPMISGLSVVNGGCGCGSFTPFQVGISFTTTYPAGSSGGVCVFTHNGADLLSADPSCPGNGVASHQFGSQAAGSQTYCAYIRMPDGETSNQLCKTITVG